MTNVLRKCGNLAKEQEKPYIQEKLPVNMLKLKLDVILVNYNWNLLNNVPLRCHGDRVCHNK